MPASILYRVCLALEDNHGDILNRKHRRNLDVLSMMDAHESWRDIIVKFDDLFRNIAFDTSDPCMIATAARILETIETKPIELEVLIRSTFRDLIGTTALHVTAKEFIRRLGLQSGRFVTFELQSQTSHLMSYFSLPAPKLRFLLQDCTVSPNLFSSLFPNLRVLHTRANKVVRIPPSALFNLVELRLVNSHRTRRFSMESVLVLLGNARQLEVLQLSGFIRFSCASTAVKPVELTNLKSVQFIGCHLQELLPRLLFPQLCQFNFSGSDFTPDENTLPSMVGSTDFFSPLRACPLPILDQRTLNHIFLSVGDEGDKIETTLRLVSGPDSKYQFVVTAAWDKWANWEKYLEQSIRGAMEQIRLAPSVSLYLFHYVDHAWAPYSALLRLPQISMLCTAGCFTPVAFKLLTDSGGPKWHPPLPRLKCFCFKGDDLHVPTEIRSSVELCLRSRHDNRRPLAIRRWIPCGDEIQPILPLWICSPIHFCR